MSLITCQKIRHAYTQLELRFSALDDPDTVEAIERSLVGLQEIFQLLKEIREYVVSVREWTVRGEITEKEHLLGEYHMFENNPGDLRYINNMTLFSLGHTLQS